MAQTPPCHLPNIPGVTSPGTLIEDSKVEVNNLNNLNNHDRKHAVGKCLGGRVGSPGNSSVSWLQVENRFLSYNRHSCIGL
ncbi:unnamed protein product [Gulo gulo]|uniref:Uncharacterized protein n=1 Tax=Gulo gulo TaxID=48420 RepID=A0A9X9LXB9_GULGU|nr:unnamed protein product [Gulo gulo]